MKEMKYALLVLGVMALAAFRTVAYFLPGSAASAPMQTAVAAETVETADVPVLLYHHLGQEQEGNANILFPETFARHMALLWEHGYTPVMLQSLAAYGAGTGDLPEKPVVITFDDGYYSNYEYAFPVLAEYGFPATIFVIGASVGHMEYYKNTDFAIIPHFGLEEMAEMRASGLVSVQSHTYDMHQWAPYESGDTVRSNLLPLEGEGEDDYIQALEADIAAVRALIVTETDQDIALAYPHGQTCDLTDEVLRQAGYRITFTTDSTKQNTIVKGDADTLYRLGRLTVSPDVTDEMLLAYLEQ